MSYNGSGTFQINSSGQPVVTGTVISSTAFNALTADLATGLSTAITKGGQTTTTARVPFAQGINSTLTTDATSTTTGSIITAGGISCQKAAVVGTLLGVGMAPVNVLDITQAVAGLSLASIKNTTAGTTAKVGFQALNDTGSYFNLLCYSSTFTASGVQVAAGTGLIANGTLGLSSLSGPILFATNGTTEVARFDTSGRLGIGTTSPAAKLDVSSASANTVIAVRSSTSGSPAYYIEAAGAGTCNFIYKSAQVLRFATADDSAYTNYTERMRLDDSGRLGIGMTPSNVLDITQNQNGNSVVAILNSDGGASATTRYRLRNGTTTSEFQLFGSGFTPTGVYRANGLLVENSGAGGVTINAAAAQPIYFGINSSEVARFNTSGNLLVGTTAAAGAMSNNASVTAGAAKTYGSNATISSGVPTTIATVSTSGLYICHAYVSAFNPGLADWSNYAIISQTAGTGTAKILVTGSGNVNFTMSGNNIQITSGATADHTWAILKIA